MTRSFVVYQHTLEMLSKNDAYVNIVLGTGTLARDLQRKLRLMNLKAPYLAGDRHDPENGIWHYKRLGELPDPEQCRFILGFDVDEWTLIGPAQSEVYKLLGVSTLNHPRFVRLTISDTLGEIAGNYHLDAHVHNVYLHNGLPYRRYGDETGAAFRIHILGASSASALWLSTQSCWPELLHGLLAGAGMAAAVTVWAKPNFSTADCLTEFLRDGCFHGPELVILYNGVTQTDPLRRAEQNLLSIQSSAGVHHNIRKLQHVSREKKSNGLDHAVDTADIFPAQHRVFKALSRLLGFSLWTVIGPVGMLLPEPQAIRLLGLSRGYLERARARKDALIAALNGSVVLDYTDSFASAGDIFDMYAEPTHLTDEGNRVIAARCAKDILGAFANRIKP